MTEVRESFVYCFSYYVNPLALFVELMGHEGFINTDIAVDRVLVHIAAEQTLVAGVLFAVAIAVKAVKDFGYLQGRLVSLGRLAAEIRRLKGRPCLPALEPLGKRGAFGSFARLAGREEKDREQRC
jgi:hypothetical protein